MKTINTLVFLFSLSVDILSQESVKDSAIILQEVNISVGRLTDFSSGTKIHKIDSNTAEFYPTASLAEILNNSSPVFIKSYGIGSLATTSFRGGSASHTSILWNGVSLNNPMYSQVDLALLPSFISDETYIQYGGASAVWGSGAIGGSIHLNNEPVFRKGSKTIFHSSYGSFTNLSGQLATEISNEKISTSIKLYCQGAKNNFPYNNPYLPGNPEQRLNNSQLLQYGFMAGSHFRINDKHKISFIMWHHYGNRQIPPTLLQSKNLTSQIDNSYRVVSEWKYYAMKATYNVKMAYLDDKLKFNNPSLHDTSNSRAKSVISEIEERRKIYNGHLLNYGINNTFVTAQSEGYAKKHFQNRTALFVSHKYSFKKLKADLTTSLRKEFIQAQKIPFTYSTGIEIELSKKLILLSNAAKVYRIPSINELYWNPGGNPDILPESGYSAEASIVYKGNISKMYLQLEPTVFTRIIDNWIIWLPSQASWSPRNILQVWSRGMETHTEASLNLKDFKIHMNIITSYVVSTNQKPISENDESVNRQLIYVPMYSGNGNLSLLYKKLSLTWHQAYTGYRFTSSDNTEYLSPYWISNIFLNQKIKFKTTKMNIYVRCNNVFNKSYQVIITRVMPQRNYEAGISIIINNNKNQQPKNRL